MAVYDINRILVPDAPPEYEDHTRDVHYVPAPCQVACPIGTDAPSYIAHIWDEDYEAAFEAITSTNPFSSICGRVCDAPCEPACRRVDSDGAVQIRNLKRFVMDKLGATYRPPAAPVTRTPLRPRCPPHPAPVRRCCPTAPGQCDLDEAAIVAGTGERTDGAGADVRLRGEEAAKRIPHHQDARPRADPPPLPELRDRAGRSRRRLKQGEVARTFSCQDLDDAGRRDAHLGASPHHVRVGEDMTLTADPEARAGRFQFERAVRGFGRRRVRLFGGDDGSQYRGLQTFGYPAVDRQPGVGLERPDGGPGPGAGDAVHRSGVVAQPAQGALKIGDAVSGAVRPGVWRARGGGCGGRGALFVDRWLCRGCPGLPLPSQALCLGELSRRQPRRDPVTRMDGLLAKILVNSRGAGGGEVVPLVRLNEILGNAIAVVVPDPEFELCVGVVLLSSNPSSQRLGDTTAPPRRSPGERPRHRRT